MDLPKGGYLLYNQKDYKYQKRKRKIKIREDI